ncbi:MAG: molybdopterin-dependent oxidoreductase [Acidimicrobiales bacterium]
MAHANTHSRSHAMDPDPVESSRPWWAGALAGVVAGGFALAVGELVGALAAPKPGPVIAVSNRVIDNAPVWFIDFGKSLFGLSDKSALIVGTVILSLIFAAILGVLSLKRPAIGFAGITAFGAVGFFALGVDAQGGWGYALIVSILAVAAGVSVLAMLLTRVPHHALLPEPVTVRSAAPANPLPRATPAIERRTFIGWLTAATASAIGLSLGARRLRSNAAVEVARGEVELVTLQGTGDIEAAVSAANASPVANTPGISPVITPNRDFYLIDTAPLTPQVNPDDWTLTIKGMVDNERTYTYDELLGRANTIAPVTLSCVSNPIGGGLVGNAVWQGIPLSELLEEAGVQPGATQIRSASVDGWDCGFPTEAAFDGRTALVAVGMNGEPLPVDHGFPVRLVVSGLYGYVSATKWLKEIELTTFEDFDGFWIPRGWSKLGPVKTQSRIDTPRAGATVSPGDLAIGGVAWAPNKGIVKVEVQVDQEPWREADLGESLGVNAWRQWGTTAPITPGDHQIRVRATDAEGETQTDVITDVDPDGASGWHTIGIRA